MLSLENDLKSSPAIADFVKSDKNAIDLYSALCNIIWKKGSSEWTCTWRYAGRLVAELRNKGEGYMDFYCSGGEGYVSPVVEKLLARLGWSWEEFPPFED